MTDPYRDENSSLRAENERLRGALARERSGRRPLVALGGVAADFGLVILLRPWLNGDEAHFWGAMVILVLVPAIALWRALGGGGARSAR